MEIAALPFPLFFMFILLWRWRYFSFPTLSRPSLFDNISRSPFPQLPNVPSLSDCNNIHPAPQAYLPFLFPIVPLFQTTPWCCKTPIPRYMSSTPSQTLMKIRQNHRFHRFRRTKSVLYLAINNDTQINGVALIGIVSCSFFPGDTLLALSRQLS